MVISPASRTLLIAGIALVTGLAGATDAWAQSATWSSETVQLQPAELARARPVVVALALDPAGRRLAIAGDDHAIRVWDLAERRVVQRLVGHTDWVRGLDYSSDGHLLASVGNDGRALLWSDNDPQPQRELLRCNEALTAVAFRPGTTQLASTGFHEPLRVFDTLTGKQTSQLACPCSDMRAIAFSPAANLMAGGGRNGKIRIWDPVTGDILSDSPAHRQRIRNLRFSPDGKWLASCGEDRRVRVAAVNGEDEFLLPQGRAKVMSLVFVGPNRLATGGSDNAVQIWDLGTRESEARLTGHTGSVMALAYQGGTLVSAGFDATVRIWRQQTAASIRLEGPPASVGRTEVFDIR